MREELKELIEKAESGDMQAQYELAHEYYVAEYARDIDGADCEEKAFFWFEKAAAQGHIEANFWLAHCLKCGVGIRYSNSEAALPYALKAAEGGLVEAMEMLFELYSHEMSCTKWDYEAALKWLKKAAESGSTKAKYRLGKLYIEGFLFDDSKKYKFKLDPAEGVKWLKLAAEEGDGNAFAKLGDCYLNGTGVEKDGLKAVEYYERGAAARNVDCNFKLGEMYFNGELVEKDLKKAFDYYDAVRWSARGLKRIGDFYYNGWVVERDLDKAVYYYDCAATQDNYDFYGVLSEVALIFARDEKLHDEKKAVRLLHIACNMGHNPEVFFERGKRHLIGVDFRDEECQFENRVIRKDLDEAKYYLKKAAELGHVEAKEILKGLKL